MNKLPYISKASDLGIALTLAATPAEARTLLGVGSGGGGGGAVDSVNGKTGVVTLGAADVGAAPVGAPVSSFANDAGYITNADIPGSPVVSVNGKTGVVALAPVDIGAATASQGAKADAALPANAVGVSVAPLVSGLIPNSALPPLAITSTFVVSSQAAQLALTVQEGDVCVRTDQGKSYIRNNVSLGTMADWQELLTPTAPVQSVNGQTGVVNLTAANVGAATTAQGTKADTAVQPAALATKQDVPSAWVTVSTFLNSWTSYDGGATFNNVQYRRNGDLIELRGVIKNSASAASTTMFQLPVGFRPAKWNILLTLINALPAPQFVGMARVDALADGNVNLSAIIGSDNARTSINYLVLDGLSFYAV